MSDLSYVAGKKRVKEKTNHKKIRLFLLYLPFIACYILDAIANKKYTVGLGVAWIAMSLLVPVLMVFCEDFIALYCYIYSELSYRKKHQSEFVASQFAVVVIKLCAGILYIIVAIYWCYLSANPPSFL